MKVHDWWAKTEVGNSSWGKRDTGLCLRNPKSLEERHSREGITWKKDGGTSVNSAHIRSVLPQMREEAVIFIYSESNYMLIKLHEVNN